MRHQGTGVLYVLQDKLQLYVNLLPSILAYQFKSESIDNLTVVNKKLLETDIMHFIADNQIPTSSLIIVIADNASYIKKMVNDQSDEEQTKAFIDTAPFPHLTTKIISTTDGPIMYGVNLDLCKSIKQAFEKQGFSVDFVFPALAFGNEFENKDSLSAEDLTVVFKEAFVKEQYTLLPTTMVPDKEELDNVVKEATNKDIMRMYAAASIFGVLIITLVVTWNAYNPQPSQTYRGRAVDELQTIIMPSEQETKDLQVQIIHNQSATVTAVALSNSFEKYNFASVGTLLNPGQTKATIHFSQKTSPTVRGAMLAEVQKYAKEVTVVEQPDTAFDITIILP